MKNIKRNESFNGGENNMKSQEFYWDSDTDEYYYVNFQEAAYIKITKEDGKLYEFFMNIYCHRWEHVSEEIDSFKLVNDIKDIYQ